MPERHTIEVIPASEVREGDELWKESGRWWLLSADQAELLRVHRQAPVLRRIPESPASQGSGEPTDEQLEEAAHQILLAECNGQWGEAKFRWHDAGEAPHYIEVARKAFQAARFPIRSGEPSAEEVERGRQALCDLEGFRRGQVAATRAVLRAAHSGSEG